MSARVLIVATSHAQLGETGRRTGVWAEELTTPYHLLRDGGAEVTLASVAGGEIPFDPTSMPTKAGTAPGEEPEDQQQVPDSVRRFFTDPEIAASAWSTPAVGDLEGAAFDAIFLPGGHGTMWDLPGCAALARMLGAAFDDGRIVAAVCHGPAGLVSATRADGEPIVAGRRVTGFTNSEEAGVGLADVVPFLLEDRLRDLGGRFESGPDWQPFAVRDGNLVTGQNPHSSEQVARLVLEALTESGRLS